MVKKEIEMLSDLIDAIDGALRVFADDGDPEALYDLANQACALYGAEIPELQESFESLTHNSGLVKREVTTINALLKRKRTRDENAFQAGIMPLKLDKLTICPAAQEVYKSGITKYCSRQFERNVLDDMRLALELLVKQILGNGKSLEHQTEALCAKLKGYHTELRNLIKLTIDYFCKYQNQYVKHNYAVDSTELDYIIEQTSAIINFLVTVK
jgi:hypothetical protein